jgi:2-oxo-4-hydroxy-4-carboxy-5-ureidoimidazoline decarboxylase
VAEPHAVLNALAEAEARAALERCCGARRWVAAMLSRRPFPSTAALHAAAEEVWAALARADFLEAFAHHPPIGASVEELRARFASTGAWASQEQGGVKDAGESVLEALRAGNAAYQARFGYIFIVCATGKSAGEMLALLQARLQNPPEVELQRAAAEQARITRLRLDKLAQAPS